MYVHILEISSEFCEANEQANAWNGTVFSSRDKAEKRLKTILESAEGHTYELSGTYKSFVSYYDEGGLNICIQRELVF
jgi:hypothetical protein